MEEETNPPREQQASIERHAVHHQEKVGSSGTAPDGKENGEAVAVDGGFGPELDPQPTPAAMKRIRETG